MARYIYNEVKEMLDEKTGASINPMFIIKIMANITHKEYKCSAPGEVPEEKFDEFKEKVYKECLKELEKIDNFIDKIMPIYQFWKKRICTERKIKNLYKNGWARH